ncbi:MAG: DUF1499 domain-containing protein [Gammaproteobacteria bacterium]|nr:DUF1499 domain-containing protein [Gammaproteobacteria bacterium]
MPSTKSSAAAVTLGVNDGRLAACPASPNCVSSQAADAEHSIEPLAYVSSPMEARTRLKQVIAAMPRTRLVSETDNYLHYEFTTRILRFVDDVEFYFDDNARRIQVRSASRVGHSDFGVNRKRVETVRRAFMAAVAP